MKYHLVTYGCQMNTADSEEMAQPLIDRGLVATATPEDADVLIMNTCTVREQAEHRADSNLGRLREWKDQDPNRILIVAGCAASRWGTSIQKKYPYIDLVSPATQIEQFPEAIENVLKARWNWTDENQQSFGSLGRDRLPPTKGTEPSHPDPAFPFLFGTESTAYVTIMRGCNYSCSYCIVPQVRGRESYRPMKEILAEVQIKAAAGKNAVMLLGQTVNSYYDRSASGERVQDFADLLRAVDAIPTVKMIQFMSPHPKHMKPRLIEAMRDCGKVARHIHLPLQSGSSRLLAAMRRLYTRDDYRAIIDALRAAIPRLLITTDVIVGYPGETESDFADTLSLLETLRLNGLFAFKYSPRPGTDSALRADDVPNEEKEDRLQRILELNRRIVGQSASLAAQAHNLLL